MNPHSEPERLSMMLVCCYKASQSHFSHLPMRNLIAPPHHMLDAALARQVAIYVFHFEFGVPRRRIVSMLGINRATLIRNVRVINERRREPVFERAYRKIAERAGEIFIRQLQKIGEAA